MNRKYLLDHHIWQTFVDKLESIAQLYGNSLSLRGRIIGAVRDAITSNAELRTAQDLSDELHEMLMINGAPKLLLYKGQWFFPVRPAESLMVSHMVSDVVRRGDTFAVNAETGELTIIKTGECCGKCHQQAR